MTVFFTRIGMLNSLKLITLTETHIELLLLLSVSNLSSNICILYSYIFCVILHATIIFTIIPFRFITINILF